MSTYAQRPAGFHPRLSVVALAYLLDGLFLVLLAAGAVAARALGDGGELTWSLSTIAVITLLAGAAVSAFAGGVIAAVGLARGRPTSRVGRAAVVAALANAAVLPVGGLVAAVGGVDASQPFFGVTFPLTLLTALVLGVVAFRRGERIVALVLPLMIGVSVAIFALGELVGGH